jgi:hypothetical protein
MFIPAVLPVFSAIGSGLRLFMLAATASVPLLVCVNWLVVTFDALTGDIELPPMFVPPIVLVPELTMVGIEGIATVVGTMLTSDGAIMGAMLDIPVAMESTLRPSRLSTESDAVRGILRAIVRRRSCSCCALIDLILC